MMAESHSILTRADYRIKRLVRQKINKNKKNDKKYYLISQRHVYIS